MWSFTKQRNEEVMFFFIMKMTHKEVKTLRFSEREKNKPSVICFTNGLISEKDTLTEITPAICLLLSLSSTCCLPPILLTSQWLSASESCLSDKLRPRTCQEAQTFPSCQSRWWTVEECSGQIAGSCEVCSKLKSFLLVQQWDVHHHTEIQSTTDAGV